MNWHETEARARAEQRVIKMGRTPLSFYTPPPFKARKSEVWIGYTCAVVFILTTIGLLALDILYLSPRW